MLEIKCFEQVKLNFLWMWKTVIKILLHLEKKMYFQIFPPLFTSLFLAFKTVKAKNQEAAHLLWKYLWRVIAVWLCQCNEQEQYAAAHQHSKRDFWKYNTLQPISGTMITLYPAPVHPPEFLVFCNWSNWGCHSPGSLSLKNFKIIPCLLFSQSSMSSLKVWNRP